MFTTALVIYGSGFLISKGLGNKNGDSLKWPKNLYDNIKNKKKK